MTLLQAIGKLPPGYRLSFQKELDEHGDEFLTSVLFLEDRVLAGISAKTNGTLIRLTIDMLQCRGLL